MAEKREMRDAMIFLQQYGISNNMAVKIFNNYGTRVYSILKENPYQLADDIAGIGFKTADEIAARVGIRVDSEYRIRSGILFTLMQSSLDGNTYLPMEELVDKTKELLFAGPENAIDKDGIITQIQNLMMDRKLICKNENNIFSSGFYYEEQGCAVMLSDLCGSEKISASEEDAYKKRIMGIERRKGRDGWR